jgi:hypothetical protein
VMNLFVWDCWGIGLLNLRSEKIFKDARRLDSRGKMKLTFECVDLLFPITAKQ